MNTKRSFKCTYRAAMSLTPVIRPVRVLPLLILALIVTIGHPVAAQTDGVATGKNLIHQVGLGETFYDLGLPNPQSNFSYALHYKYVEATARLLFDTPGLRKRLYKDYRGGNIQLTLFCFEKRRVIEPYFSFGYSLSQWKEKGIKRYWTYDKAGMWTYFTETYHGEYRFSGIDFEPGIRINAGRCYADITPIGFEDNRFWQHFDSKGGLELQNLTSTKQELILTHKIGIGFRIQSRSEVLKYGDAY